MKEQHRLIQVEDYEQFVGVEAIARIRKKSQAAPRSPCHPCEFDVLWRRGSSTAFIADAFDE